MAVRNSSQITITLNVDLTSALKLNNSHKNWLRLLHEILEEEKRYEEWSIYHNGVFSRTFYDQGGYLPFDTQHDLPFPRVAEKVSSLRTNYPQKLQKHHVPS